MTRHFVSAAIPVVPTPVQPPLISPPGDRTEHAFLHLDQQGNAIGEVVANNVSYGIFLDRPNYVSYDISVDNRLADIRFTCPYVTDFQYARNNEVMIAGMHTEAEVNLTGTTLQISGQEWKHYLEKRVFPFNPDDPGEFFFAMVQVDTFDIVTQMLDTVLGQDGSVPFTYDLGQSGLKSNFRIEPGDTDTIMDKINQLSEEKPGFDWIVTPDRDIRAYAPEKGVRVEFDLEKNKNVADIALTNSGIRASHVLGFGAGSSNKLGVLVSDPLAQRRYDYAVDFGEIIDKGALERLANRELSLRANLALALTVTLYTTAANDFLENVTIGDTVPLTGDVQGYIYVDDYYRVVGIEGSTTDEGDETLTLTMEVPASG